MVQVRATNVTKEYTIGNETVVASDNVTLDIETGEFVIIMGPSGSGKSTVMHLIGCLDTPSHGSIELFGRHIEDATDKELAHIRGKNIGFIFQKFHLIPHLSALENVALPLVFQSVPKRERNDRAKEVLEKVGLGERLYHKPTELSGGQQQRVAIARSLVTNPQIILADEPTGNLDTESGEVVLSLLDELHNQGKTIVVVTHDINLKHRGTRLIEVKDGKIQNDTNTSTTHSTD